jgi:predicted lipoprotein with Yx(FWY)xxD motif
MRRTLGRGVLALVPLALAGAILATTAAAAAPQTVKAARIAGLGTVLTTSGGLTLYHYTDEHGGKIDCKGACATLWPPLLVKGSAKPTAGPGLTASKLGTIRRPDGRLQVTYNGLALYRYAPDRKAGDVKGQGLEREWYVIAPTGKIVTRKQAQTTPPVSTPPPTQDPPDDGYYG